MENTVRNAGHVGFPCRNLRNVLTEPQGESPRKCARLSPQEADALFFPGPGGKVNKAKAFCEDCPVRSLCFTEALELKLVGFWAGTTDDERVGIREFKGIVSEGLAAFMPDEPNKKKRRVFRKVKKETVVHASYLDELEAPPSPELLLVDIILGD